MNNIPNYDKKTVSIVITNHKGQILLLKRALHKKWYPGKWDIISGKLKDNENPKDGFARELLEETGLSNLETVESKKPYAYKEKGQKWLVHPYRCKINTNSIKLNSEHCDYKWVKINQLKHLNLATPVIYELKPFYDLPKIQHNQSR